MSKSTFLKSREKNALVVYLCRYLAGIGTWMVTVPAMGLRDIGQDAGDGINAGTTQGWCPASSFASLLFCSTSSCWPKHVHFKNYIFPIALPSKKHWVYFPSPSHDFIWTNQALPFLLTHPHTAALLQQRYICAGLPRNH